MGYMDHAYLLRTEATTAAAFADRLPEYQQRQVNYIDTLFAVGYFVDGHAPDPKDWFPYISWERLLLVPYTFRSVSTLIRATVHLCRRLHTVDEGDPLRA